MKNIISGYLFFSLLLIATVSCSDERENNGNRSGEKEIILQSGINTKAVDTNWDVGDAIGVTLYEEDYSQVIDGGLNIRYTTTGSGAQATFSAASTAETLYFPQDGRDIRVKAYYPWQANVPANMLLDWSVEDQTVLPAIDLMTATHLSGFNKDDDAVNMHFYHRLSKMLFYLSIEDNGDFVTLADCELTIKGTRAEDTYDLFNDDWMNVANPLTDIDVPLRNNEADNYRQAIIMPRAAGDGVVFEFETPTGDTYIAYMSDTLELKGGNQYTFYLELGKNPITVSATIEPWIENDPQYYETLLVSTPAGDSEGVNIGDIMNVYIQDPANSNFSLLRRFEYQSANNWQPETPVYWEDIDQDPAVLRSSIIAAPALNSTQLPDILISEEISVARNTGANFTLTHALSKVIVQLRSDTFTDPELDNATITLPNYLVGGYEDLGTFVPGTARTDIELDSIAIFQPQNVAGADPLVAIEINGRTYNAYETNGFTYEPGNAYRLIISVLKEGVTVSATVIDWNEVTEELDAITIGTAVSGGEGVYDGEVLNVYTGDNTSRAFLNSYTYDSIPDIFNSLTTSYWEGLPDPTTFYGYIERAPAHNSTQLPDYLVAQPVTVAASNGVHFELSHAAAQVVVQLRSESNTDNTFTDAELAAMDISLPGYYIGGHMDNGVFVPGTNTGTIDVERVGQSAIALIQPQDRTAGSTVLSIQSANRTYTATSGQTINFEAGVTTILTVNLTKTAVTISATVTDWVAGPTINLLATALEVSGQIGTTDGFFNGKTIFLYNLAEAIPEEIPYSYSTANGWTGQTIYWEDQPGLALNLAAIYNPTNNAPTLSGQTFNWMIARDQSDEANGYYARYDLLMSTLNMPSPQRANFNFTHATSKVTIKLVAGTGFEDDELENAEVVLNNFLLTGTADLATGGFTSTSNSQNVTPYTVTNGAEYTALVMPQTKNPGDLVASITLSEYQNTPFEARLAANASVLNFEAGKETVITIRLNKTRIELSATLEPWVNGDEGLIIIE